MIVGEASAASLFVCAGSPDPRNDAVSMQVDARRVQGGVAERLCSGLQIRLGRFDSDPRLQRPDPRRRFVADASHDRHERFDLRPETADIYRIRVSIDPDPGRLRARVKSCEPREIAAIAGRQTLNAENNEKSDEDHRHHRPLQRRAHGGLRRFPTRCRSDGAFQRNLQWIDRRFGLSGRHRTIDASIEQQRHLPRELRLHVAPPRRRRSELRRRTFRPLPRRCGQQ